MLGAVADTFAVEILGGSVDARAADVGQCWTGSGRLASLRGWIEGGSTMTRWSSDAWRLNYVQ